MMVKLFHGVIHHFMDASFTTNLLLFSSVITVSDTFVMSNVQHDASDKSHRRAVLPA